MGTMKYVINQRKNPYRKGLNVRNALNTFNTPSTPLFVFTTYVTKISTNDITTKTKSILFQPLFKYAAESPK